MPNQVACFLIVKTRQLGFIVRIHRRYFAVPRYRIVSPLPPARQLWFHKSTKLTSQWLLRAVHPKLILLELSADAQEII